MIATRIAALLLGCLLAGMASVQAVNHQLRGGFSVNHKSPAAPQLRLKDVDGRQYDLSAMQGRVVVINFWATWCPPCIEEMPTIQNLWADTHTSGLEVLAVNVGEPAGAIRAFLADFEPKLEFPVLLDPKGEAFQTWRVRGLPKTFVVDKRGNIIYEAEGGRDMNSEHIRGRLQVLIDE